jgi:hypothetical protein
MKTTVGLNRTDFNHWEEPVQIDTARHTAIVGTTGAGKSTVMREAIAAEIEAGNGVTLIDPHGQLVDDVLQDIPDSRKNDVIYWDPSDPEFAVVVNLLESAGELTPKIADEAGKIVAGVWPDAWGPQTDYLFRNFTKAVLEVETKPTFLHVFKAYMDREYRTFLHERVTDPAVTSFFDTYEDEWDKRQQEQASAPGKNKVDTFMQWPLRNVVSARTGLDFRRILDGSQILLCRFSKGRIGPTAGAFLGSVVIAKTLFAALEREDTPHRPPHRIFIDEAGLFLCGTAHEQLLSEARKYGVSLTLGFQFVEQLDVRLRAAVFGNVGSLLTGRVNAEDAKVLAAQIGLPDGKTLQQLPNFGWYVRTVRNGIPSDPIRMEGLPPRRPIRKEDHAAQIISRSRTRYGTSISTIEKHIATFLGGPHEARKRRQGERGQKAVGRRNPGRNQRPARHARNDRRAVG